MTDKDKVPGGIIPSTVDHPMTIHQMGRVTDKETGQLEYVLGFIEPGKQPAIQSAKTGNVYLIPWDILTEMAVMKGVDEVQILRPAPSSLIVPGR